MESEDKIDDLIALRIENQRLIALLELHRIDWRAPAVSEPDMPLVICDTVQSTLNASERVALFRRLFQGRIDVYSIRWESQKTGKSGYSPVCANEWVSRVCEKPRISCADCSNRVLVPLSDDVIFKHLTGKLTAGVYPLLSDDTCHFLAADFDEAEWAEDAKAFVLSCHVMSLACL